MHLKIYTDYTYRKAGKVQKRGKVNLIGRLQLTTEKTKEEDNEGIIALRVLRTQVKISLHLVVVSVTKFTGQLN